MTEIWKNVNGYENLYKVSSYGRIFSIKSQKILKLYKKKLGYYEVGLYKDSKRKDFLIHRLVAEAFIPNPENKPQVNHLDENKSNNNLKNLNWMTSSENINYGERTRKAISNSKRKPVVCFNKQGERTEFNSIQEASRMLGLYASNICYCLKGRLKTTGGYKFEYK